MVIKEFFSVPILSVVVGSSVAFRSPVVERLHCICFQNNFILLDEFSGNFQKIKIICFVPMNMQKHAVIKTCWVIKFLRYVFIRFNPEKLRSALAVVTGTVKYNSTSL